METHDCPTFITPDIDYIRHSSHRTFITSDITPYVIKHMSGAINVWCDQCPFLHTVWWMSGVMNVWCDECPVWWMSNVMNVCVMNVGQSNNGIFPSRQYFSHISLRNNTQVFLQGFFSYIIIFATSSDSAEKVGLI